MDVLFELKSRLDQAGIWEKKLIINRNEYLKVQGSTDTNVYFVQSGSLRIFLLDEAQENTIRFGYQGDLIAAIDSFITGRPSEYYIQAIRKTEVLAVNKETYMKFINSNDELKDLWNEMLYMLILMQAEREKDLLISSPHERYKRVLKRSPQLFQEIPLKYIASYLRMTPETLSRMRKS